MQWDIGVQRHRRRRAHAVASAARTASAIVSAAPRPTGSVVPALPADSPEPAAALAASHSPVLLPQHNALLLANTAPASVVLQHQSSSLTPVADNHSQGKVFSALQEGTAGKPSQQAPGLEEEGEGVPVPVHCS